MAIAFDAKSNSTVNSASGSWNHTVGTGSDRVLIVFFSRSGYDSDLTVTYNGTAMTLAAKTTSPFGAFVYYLVNPDSGTHSIAWTATVGRATIGSAMSVTGAAQTSTIGASNSATAGDTTTSVSITTESDNSWIVDIMSVVNSTTRTPDGAQTEISVDSSGTQYTGTSYKLLATAGATTMSWTVGSNLLWSALAVEIKEAAAILVNTKSINGLAKASVKSKNGLAIASIKSINGLE